MRGMTANGSNARTVTGNSGRSESLFTRHLQLHAARHGWRGRKGDGVSAFLNLLSQPYCWTNIRQGRASVGRTEKSRLGSDAPLFKRGFSIGGKQMKLFPWTHDIGA